METTLYLIRHSQAERINPKENEEEHFQKQMESTTLLPIGIKKAQILCELPLLQNLDAVISSYYVRTLETAGYLAKKNNLEVIVNNNIGERKYGLTSFENFPSDFEQRQFVDEDYKMDHGESQKEVRQRMLDSILKIIEEYKGKKIAVVSHATAITFLFMTWCQKEKDNKLIFDGNIVIDGNWNAPEIFKLIFDDDNPISIERIRPKELVLDGNI